MILVGVPCTEYIKTRTTFALFNLALKEKDLKLTMQMSCDVAYNRNQIVEQALREGHSHLLFIDSDVSFEATALERLLKHDKDIVATAYNFRKLPLESVVMPLDSKDKNKALPVELFEAASAGTGVMLIKTEVFKKIDKPWFKFEYLDGERISSEDVRFCVLAREAGFKIWVDPTIPVNHVGEYLY